MRPSCTILRPARRPRSRLSSSPTLSSCNSAITTSCSTTSWPSIYANIKKTAHWYDAVLGRHYARAARQVHALFIDVNELTDRTENALKIVGDVYAARLFSLVGARLGLDRWKTNVSEKLKTLDDIYRFSVERLSMVRGEMLEMMIVGILVFELVLFFMGIMD